MAFSTYFEVTAPERRVSIEDDELPILTLQPFGNVPKLFFKNVLVGEKATKHLMLRNPQTEFIEIELLKLPPERTGISFNSRKFNLHPLQESVLEVYWQPTQEGKSIYSVPLKTNTNGRFSFNIVCVSVQKKPQNKKGKINRNTRNALPKVVLRASNEENKKKKIVLPSSNSRRVRLAGNNQNVMNKQLSTKKIIKESSKNQENIAPMLQHSQLSNGSSCANSQFKNFYEEKSFNAGTSNLFDFNFSPLQPRQGCSRETFDVPPFPKVPVFKKTPPKHFLPEMKNTLEENFLEDSLNEACSATSNQCEVKLSPVDRRSSPVACDSRASFLDFNFSPTQIQTNKIDLSDISELDDCVGNFSPIKNTCEISFLPFTPLHISKRDCTNSQNPLNEECQFLIERRYISEYKTPINTAHEKSRSTEEFYGFKPLPQKLKSECHIPQKDDSSGFDNDLEFKAESMATSATIKSHYSFEISPVNWKAAQPLCSKPFKRETAIRIIQKYVRAWMLGKRQREIYIRQKCAALKIQSWFRATVATRHQRMDFMKQKRAAVKIQSWYRSTVAMKHDRAVYKLQRESAIKIQRWFRTVLIILRLKQNLKIRMEAQEKFKLENNAAIKIQGWYRSVAAKLKAKECRRQLGAKQKDSVKRIEHWYYNILCQRKRAAMLEMQKKQQELSTKNLCAMKIQASWRGYCTRKKINVQSGSSNNEPSQKYVMNENISLRTKYLKAVKQLNSAAPSYAILISSSMIIECCVRLSLELCEEFLRSPHMNDMVQVLQTLNRSIPAENLLVNLIKILTHVLRHPLGPQQVLLITDFVPLLTDLTNTWCTKQKEELFCYFCTAWWLLGQDSKAREIVKSYQWFKLVLPKCAAKVKSWNNHTPAKCQTTPFKNCLPDITPSWYSRRTNRPKMFQSGKYAIAEVLKTFQL